MEYEKINNEDTNAFSNKKKKNLKKFKKTYNNDYLTKQTLK